MKRRAFTMLEVMVGSGVLLLMVAMASMATISYLRAYRHYTTEGARLRLAAKTMETVCFHLRSARALEKIPQSLQAGAFQYENTNRQHCLLQLRGDQIWLQRDQQALRLGAASDLRFRVKDGLLELSLPVAGQANLQTALSLRGLAR